MIITDITPQKRKGRHNISVDGEFYSGIDSMALAEAGLKVGQEVDEKRLKELVFASETRSAFDKIAALLATPKSKVELRRKLREKGYASDVIDAAIQKAEDYGYINDKEYARLLVGAKPLKSRLELRASLAKRGVSKEDINGALVDVGDEDEAKKAEYLAEKYLAKKEKTLKNLASLNGYLLRKGFGMDIVSNIINKLRDEYGGD